MRDTATRLGKQVELHLHGEHTELDKSVIEKLSDPLTHIVRNSIDHGIETPAERLAAGKPASGTVKLVARLWTCPPAPASAPAAVCRWRRP